MLSRQLENIGNDWETIYNEDDVLAECKNEASLMEEIGVVKKEKKVTDAELKEIPPKNKNVDKSDNTEFELSNSHMCKKNESSFKQEIGIVKKEKKNPDAELKKNRSKNKFTDKNAEFEVEKILDHTNNIIARKFLIRWKGYDSGHDSWVTRRQLNCPKLLADYLKRNNL